MLIQCLHKQTTLGENKMYTLIVVDKLTTKTVMFENMSSQQECYDYFITYFDDQFNYAIVGA